MSPRAVTLAALVTLCSARSATAQTIDPEAEHRRGMQLRAEGHDAEAVVVFRALFERTGEPRALARLGLAEGALSRWIDAEEHLEGALARPADPWVLANRGQLEEALRSVRQHLGRVSVRCATPGATVRWADHPPAPLPLQRPLRVPTGFVDLVVHAPGHQIATRRVAVTAGDEPVTVEVALIREEGAATSAPSAPTNTPPTNTPPAVTPPVDAPRRGGWQRPLGIGLLAGAGVSLGIGVLGVILREGAAGRFNSAGCLLHPDRDEVSTRGGSCSDELSSAQTGEALSIAGFVAAGVLGGLGVTALLLSPSTAREPARVSVTLSPSARGATAGVTVGF